MAVYAVSDIHGRYDLFQAIKDHITPKDTVYVLGDCGDRGPNGWKIIKEVLEDPRFIYIKGNHEDMLINAMRGMDRQLCFMNGGKSTYEAWRYGEDGGDRTWAIRLGKLPVEQVYINQQGERVVLCHAGYTPHCEQKVSYESYLWSRSHFNQMWDMNFVDTIVVHGHTPVPYMAEYLDDFTDAEIDDIFPGALWYSYDDKGRPHKCNIDCGTAFTGVLVMLNLDTWEELVLRVNNTFDANEKTSH